MTSRNFRITSMRREGVSPAQIAKNLGLTRGVVSGVLNRANIVVEPLHAKCVHDSARRAAALDAASRSSIAAAAAEWGFSASTLGGWVRRERHQGAGA